MSGKQPPQYDMLTVGPFRQHTSLLWRPETGCGVIFDPGGETDRLLGIIDGYGLTIEAIVLTHGHLDHVGGAAEMQERLTARQGGVHVPVIGPDSRDAFLMSSVEESAAHFGVSGLRNVKADRDTSDGEVVNVAGMELHVRHVPGHTPGHVVYFCPEADVVFAGDTLFRGTVGRTDFPYGDGPLLSRMIRERILPMGDKVVVIPGHGLPTNIGEERRNNPFLQ